MIRQSAARRVSGDSFDHSWRRIQQLKLSGIALFNEIAPSGTTERVMADFSGASTKQTSHWPAPISSWKAPVRFHVILCGLGLFALAGCNANQTLNPSSRTAPGVVAGLARLMREICPPGTAEAALQTNDRQPARAFPVAPNLLNQDFNATGPNQKWGCLDISYVTGHARAGSTLPSSPDLFCSARRRLGRRRPARIRNWRCCRWLCRGSSTRRPRDSWRKIYNRFHRWAMRGWWHSLRPKSWSPPQEPISSGNSSSSS